MSIPLIYWINFSNVLCLSDVTFWIFSNPVSALTSTDFVVSKSKEDTNLSFIYITKDKEDINI